MVALLAADQIRYAFLVLESHCIPVECGNILFIRIFFLSFYTRCCNDVYFFTNNFSSRIFFRCR